jgi:hypothetical protein
MTWHQLPVNAKFSMFKVLGHYSRKTALLTNTQRDIKSVAKVCKAVGCVPNELLFLEKLPLKSVWRPFFAARLNREYCTLINSFAMRGSIQTSFTKILREVLLVSATSDYSTTFVLTVIPLDFRVLAHEWSRARQRKVR